MRPHAEAGRTLDYTFPHHNSDAVSTDNHTRRAKMIIGVSLIFLSLVTAHPSNQPETPQKDVPIIDRALNQLDIDAFISIGASLFLAGLGLFVAGSSSKQSS